MELYRVVIKRPNRLVTGYLVSPDEERVSEVVIEHEVALNQENSGFTIERVDETLPDDQQLGLEALLEHAPVGFASFCEGVGWLAHMAPVRRLKLYSIEEVEGDRHFVIAPSSDMAEDIYCQVIPLDHGEARQFQVHDGLFFLTNARLRNLPALLEMGPIGMVEWDDETGWSAKTW
jgi:hypothetical protein